jgi:serine/threonine protein phosphatase PrpC
VIHYLSGKDNVMSDGHKAVGIRYALRSDVGLQRDGNEDSAYAGSRLLAVADGLGGHAGGEVASAAAINALKAFDTEIPAGELVSALGNAVRQANAAVRDLAESDPALRGMGTTLTAMLWSGSQLALVQIGDSRAYLLRDGELGQITHDQTVVQALVDSGRITAEEALSHPQRSMILQALDGGTLVPDLQLREAQLGDRYLLCSDGLYGVVGMAAIQEVLGGVPDPDQAAGKLIELANQGGGPDNITCVVADVIELPEPASADPVS